MKALDRIFTGAKRMALPAVAVLGSYLGNPAYSQETETEKPLVAYVQQDKTNNSKEVKEEKLEGESNIGKPLPTTPKIVFYNPRTSKDENGNGKLELSETRGRKYSAGIDDQFSELFVYAPNLEKGDRVEVYEMIPMNKITIAKERTDSDKKIKVLWLSHIMKENGTFQSKIENPENPVLKKLTKTNLMNYIGGAGEREVVLKINNRDRKIQKLSLEKGKKEDYNNVFFANEFRNINKENDKEGVYCDSKKGEIWGFGRREFSPSEKILFLYFDQKKDSSGELKFIIKSDSEEEIFSRKVKGNFNKDKVEYFVQDENFASKIDKSFGKGEYSVQWLDGEKVVGEDSFIIN